MHVLKKFDELRKRRGARKRKQSGVHPQYTADCTIEAGTLTAKQHVWAFATGDVSTGDVTLEDDDTGMFAPSGHDIRIYSNFGGSGADTFDVGGGGSNGTGTLSNTCDLANYLGKFGELFWNFSACRAADPASPLL
jgi:hypothetical protein